MSEKSIYQKVKEFCFDNESSKQDESEILDTVRKSFVNGTTEYIEILKKMGYDN